MQKIIAALAVAATFTASAAMLTDQDVEDLNYELSRHTGVWLDPSTHYDALFLEREGNGVVLIHGFTVTSDFLGQGWVQAQHHKLLPFAEEICNEPLMLMEAEFENVRHSSVMWIYLFQDQPAVFEYNCEDIRSSF